MMIERQDLYDRVTECLLSIAYHVRHLKRMPMTAEITLLDEVGHEIRSLRLMKSSPLSVKRMHAGVRTGHRHGITSHQGGITLLHFDANVFYGPGFWRPAGQELGRI
jgi:hypothetical protein